MYVYINWLKGQFLQKVASRLELLNLSNIKDLRWNANLFSPAAKSNRIWQQETFRPRQNRMVEILTEYQTGEQWILRIQMQLSVSSSSTNPNLLEIFLRRVTWGKALMWRAKLGKWLPATKLMYFVVEQLKFTLTFMKKQCLVNQSHNGHIKEKFLRGGKKLCCNSAHVLFVTLPATESYITLPAAANIGHYHCGELANISEHESNLYAN